MKVRRLLLGVLAAVPLLPAGPTALARARLVTAADLGSEAYWTPARMAVATPLGRRADEGVPEVGIPTARAVPGSKVIGALFFNNGSGGHYCTASVVRTPKRNMLITAAHCLYNQATHGWHRHIVFVPRYSAGHRPYGTWPVWLMVADKRWIEHGDPDLDFGFAAVQVMRGRRLADVVGANDLLTDRGYTEPRGGGRLSGEGELPGRPAHRLRGPYVPADAVPAEVRLPRLLRRYEREPVAERL